MLQGVLNIYGQTEAGVTSGGCSIQNLGTVQPGVRMKVTVILVSLLNLFDGSNDVAEHFMPFVF